MEMLELGGFGFRRDIEPKGYTGDIEPQGYRGVYNLNDENSTGKENGHWVFRGGV